MYLYIYTHTMYGKNKVPTQHSTLLNQALSSYARVVRGNVLQHNWILHPFSLTCLSSAGMYLNVDRVPGVCPDTLSANSNLCSISGGIFSYLCQLQSANGLCFQGIT